MKKFFSSKGRKVNPWMLAIVSVFFVWHIFAIAIFSIPLNVHDPVSRPFRQFFRPIVTPYVNILGQWQDWRVYISPDPLHFEKRFAVDFVHKGTVTDSYFLSPEQGKSVEENVGNIAPKLLEVFCMQHLSRKGDEARLVQRWYLDRADPPMDTKVFDVNGAAMDRSFEWYEYTYATLPCFKQPS